MELEPTEILANSITHSGILKVDLDRSQANMLFLLEKLQKLQAQVHLQCARK